VPRQMGSSRSLSLFRQVGCFSCDTCSLSPLLLVCGCDLLCVCAQKVIHRYVSQLPRPSSSLWAFRHYTFSSLPVLSVLGLGLSFPLASTSMEHVAPGSFGPSAPDWFVSGDRCLGAGSRPALDYRSGSRLCLRHASSLIWPPA